jgi:hypothetical protein
VKKEQIIDMIGEAPDHYVKDATTYKKRRIPQWKKWLGGIAALLAVVLLANNMPDIPLIISAKAVSVASPSRKLEYPKNRQNDSDWKARWEAWRTQEDVRGVMVRDSRQAVADFSRQLSNEVLTGIDGINRVWSPINAYIALAMTAELTGSETREQVWDVLGVADNAELRQRISAIWEEIYENNG